MNLKTIKYKNPIISGLVDEQLVQVAARDTFLVIRATPAKLCVRIVSELLRCSVLFWILSLKKVLGTTNFFVSVVSTKQ
jgi:hypothetical protein